MIKLFVDTNALLGFFAYSSDDLAQLQKLVAEVAAGKIELLLTDQVRNEFFRNREGKIAETLRGFTEKAGIDKFPRLIQHYDDFTKLEEATKAYKDLKENIILALDNDILKRTLPADLTFDEITNVAKVIETTPQAIADAKMRIAVGNPPGKRGSLGDAINWELLMKACPKESDLFVVTQDRDFVSPIDSTRFSEFLADEWRERCSGKVYLFANLRSLFKEIAPDIKLSAATTSISANTVATATSSPTDLDDEIEKAVLALETSGSFISTHGAIATMPDFWLLSNDQVERLLRAAVENNQIAWIYSDPDVSNYFKELYAFGKKQLAPDVAEKFHELYLAN